MAEHMRSGGEAKSGAADVHFELWAGRCELATAIYQPIRTFT